MLARIFVLMVVFVSACGGHSDNPDSSSSNGSPPTDSTPSTVTTTLNPSGGTVSLPSVATLTFQQGAVSTPAAVTITKRIGDASSESFSNGAAGYGLVDSEDFDLKIDVAAEQVLNDTTTLSVTLSDSMNSLANAGRLIAVFSEGTDVSNDDDEGELLDVYDLIDGTYDSSSRTITVTLPSTSFEPALGAQDGYVAANIRVAALPDYGTSSVATKVSLQGIRSGDGMCPGDASFGAPYTYGWREAANGNPLLYYDAIAGVNGPFGEERWARNKSGKKLWKKPGHMGIDFFADDGTPILAVADGFLETVQDANSICTAQGPKDKKVNKKLHPEFFAVLAITDASGNVTDHVVYRHLTKDSVGLRRTAGVVKEKEFATCWQARTPNDRAKYTVKKGEQIALSGHTGPNSTDTDWVGPHLHFEWTPSPGNPLGRGKLEAMRNPLCKLATFFPGKIDPQYSTNPNQAEVGERLYVQPAPGTVDYNGRPNTLAEI